MSQGQSAAAENDPARRTPVVQPVAPPPAYVRPDPYASPLGYQPADSTIDLRAALLAYWQIIQKRKLLILAMTAGTLLFSLVSTLMETPMYTATVRLQIDRSSTKAIDGGSVTADDYDYEFLKTQYELLQARAISERVVAALNLGADDSLINPAAFSLFDKLTGKADSNGASSSSANSDWSKEDRAAVAADIVMGNTSVDPVAGSRLVDVSYSDPSPDRALRITAAYADAFIASNVDKRFEANAYAKTFLDDQIKQLKVRLEQSEKVLLDFAEKEQIVAVTEKSSIAESNLAAANAALGALVSERIKSEQLWRQVDTAKGIDLPQFQSNKVIDGLRARRKDYTTEYQEKLETFKPSYPAMVALDNKIRELDRQIESETTTIKNSLKADYESAVKQEESMKARIATLREEVLDLQKRSVQYNILKREVDTNREMHNGLLQRFKQVDVAGGLAANNVFVVDRPVMPDAPSSPNLRRALMIAFLFGIGASLASAYLLEQFDDRIRTPAELERASGLVTLGVVPKVPDGIEVKQAMADPRSAFTEAYRSLCTSLQFSTETGLPRTLAVTSSSLGEGKSVTALMIARHFAMVNMKVLLIDGDLRNPSLHTKLGMPNALGLSSYLTGKCSPPEAFQATNLPTLAFMSAGPIPPNAADLIAGARLPSLLSIASEVFDLIIIDCPPVMGLADAPLLANMVAGTVFVVGAGQARTRNVRDTLRRLHMGRSPLLGAVLTKYDTSNGVGDYGTAYDYSYGASIEKKSTDIRSLLDFRKRSSK